MSVIEKIIQNNNEQLIGYWKLSIAPFQNNETISGYLFVTNKKIYFESGYHYLLRKQIDSNRRNLNNNRNDTNIFSQELIEQWYDYGYFIINKQDIKKIEEQSSLLKKVFTIILSDETKYNFSNGIFPIKKITNAINNINF